MSSKISKLQSYELKRIVDSNTSFAGILKEIGLSPRGGNINTLKKYLEKNNISYAHIPEGKDSNSGRKEDGLYQKCNLFKVYIAKNKNDYEEIKNIKEIQLPNFHLNSMSCSTVSSMEDQDKISNSGIWIEFDYCHNPNNLIEFNNYLKNKNKLSVQIELLDNKGNTNSLMLLENCKINQVGFNRVLNYLSLEFLTFCVTMTFEKFNSFNSGITSINP